MFLLPGYRDMPGLTAEFASAGVQRVVLLSSQAAVATDTGNAIPEFMIRSEDAVRESGLAWMFLRPAAFMSNALRWLPQFRSSDIVSDAFGDLTIAVIDPADIAAVATRALLEPGHEVRAYSLSGPEALLPADRVRILGQAPGRDLRFQPETDEDARARMSATMPKEYVDAFFSFYRDHTIDETTVHATVEQLTGRPPRIFDQWTTAHASEFRT
ncbi:nucleoside-diphosphate sugar epimerase [Streptomyces chartreusis]